MSMKLYVGNIHYSTNEDELTNLFKPFGELQSINIIRDKMTGKSKGFAFVEMTNRKQGEAAIKGLNNTSIKKRAIKVNEALHKHGKASTKSKKSLETPKNNEENKNIRELGSIEKIYNLAFSCENDTEKDYRKAINLYKQLADDGHAKSMSRLGYMHTKGLGVKADNKEAIIWYHKAVQKGDPMGMAFLGRMYEQGLGVSQNYKEAIKLYEQAAQQGDPMGMTFLGWMYEERLGKNYLEAIKWYQKAAKLGNAKAMHSLGCIHQFGKGVAIDYLKATVWYKQAADLGDAISMRDLGWMYDQALGVEQDYKEAANWYKKAAAKGDAEAMYRLGWLYKEKLPERNYKESINWYKQAAAAGHIKAKAMYHLGLMHEQGLGTRKNSELGVAQNNVPNYGYIEVLDKNKKSELSENIVDKLNQPTDSIARLAFNNKESILKDEPLLSKRQEDKLEQSINENERHHRLLSYHDEDEPASIISYRKEHLFDPNKSVVYFIQENYSKFIKIGYTNNISKRVSQIETNNPHDVKILLLIPGGQEEEQKFHKKFEDQRKKREWFHPEKITSFIQEYWAKEEASQAAHPPAEPAL